MLTSTESFVGQVAAYQGRYQDAAKLYAKGGMIKKAMEMFGDLRQFDAAKHWAEEYAKVCPVLPATPTAVILSFMPAAWKFGAATSACRAGRIGLPCLGTTARTPGIHRHLCCCGMQEAGDAGTMQDLINRQAEWSEEVNDYAAAADMYLKVIHSRHKPLCLERMHALFKERSMVG